jgi:hypothetical protein
MPHVFSSAPKRLNGYVNKIVLPNNGSRYMLTLVQLLKRERFRFGDKEQDSTKSEDVPPGIPSECTLRFECS